MTPRQLIRNAGDLVSLPEICVRINQLVDDPTSSAEEMAQVISQDASLTARLLKIVNSAFYGFPGRIDTIARAITVIGTRDLRDLALMTAACELFTGVPANLIDMERFWHSSLTCGVLARRLARSCRVLHPDRLFVMGVLHDIGRLVLFQQLPVASRDILLISKGRDDLIVAAEREVFGFTHGDVGYELACDWRLPAPICSAIRWHHLPEQATTDLIECTLVYIANILADSLVWDSEPGVELERVLPGSWQITGLTPVECERAVSEMGDEVRELYAILMRHAPAPQPSLVKPGLPD
ncbi:HDOD domain-containing protein [Sedimenticola hydrogenitrophicus]|uniref:HDOD domain-containing protein n=1 Tax=Sedimenticola hydrogenitrophicus TaxID=2967975 RepID=UPI0021A4B688|nr:HDOD domain-containing protein [Sedimenticola hydrogenitrophicus]